MATAVFFAISAEGAALPVAAHFRANVLPILDQYCGDCHEDGANKGGVSFDQFKSDEALTTNRTLWFNALKNLRAGLMPPAKKPRPSANEMKRIVDWIKYEDFHLDPKNPDPGRVTLRRLNRVEYRNSIRDLMGVDYDTTEEFPADDTGYGFDDIGDVLTLSPMLFEKYLDAAKTIVAKAVPMVSRVPKERVIPGQSFSQDGGWGSLWLSYYEHASVSKTLHVTNGGPYELLLDLAATEQFVEDDFDYNKCRVTFKADGQELLRKEFIREGDKPFHFEFKHDFPPGDHQLTFEVEPLTPNEKKPRSLAIRFDSVTVRGPFDGKYYIAPKNYARFFPREVPAGSSARHAYARELISTFASKAFRHPADADTVDRLAGLAEDFYKQRGKTFEAGVAQAMTAVLASPQFLFREENIEPDQPPGTEPLVDEYALASRLSYFLWSSMPDDELIQLAAKKQLRANLPVEVKRMLADWRSDAFIQNFTGQWLQARDIDSVPIDSAVVLEGDEHPDPEIAKLRARLHELREKPREQWSESEHAEAHAIYLKLSAARSKREFGPELRHSMRREVEAYFNHIVHDDRNVMELIDSDYTYLNGRLARHYGLTNLNVSGSEMVRVTLPPGCPRGGVLTMGCVLAVTSNPTRTSPVKRGLFILDNILGTPTPPQPANVPLLEDSDHEVNGHQPTLREVLAIHREKPICSSCHNRMDPLGLALENFNAMGMWREHERDQPIDASGTLITGESFKNIHELKHILVANHREDFYRTLTEKLLTYAIGRGLDYYDVETVDQIVNRLDRENGRFSALLDGIIESAPFQKRRYYDRSPVVPSSSGQVGQRAERN